MAKKPPPAPLTVSDLVSDNDNANRGTERGSATIEKSLRAFGVGRPVVVDKNDKLIAGNKTHEAAIKAGITKIRIVETSGDELIVHKRTDLDLDSRVDNRARGLAIADNRVGQISQDMDLDVVRRQIEDFSLDVADIGYEIKELEVVDKPDASESKTEGSGSGEGSVGEHYGVYVQCESEAEQKQVFEEMVKTGRKARLMTL